MLDGQWLTPLPLDRDAALDAVASRWSLGVGAAAIRLAVPAMSFARFQRFGRVAMTLRLMLGTDLSLTLYKIADRLPEDDNIRELTKSALDRWRAEYGRLPTALTDLLMDVSEPEDPEQAWHILMLWAASHGVHWRSPADPLSEPWQIRRALSYYASHTMTVDSAVEVLAKAAEAQYSVKKKLLTAPLETPEQDQQRREKDHRQRYLQTMARIRSGEIRAGQ